MSWTIVKATDSDAILGVLHGHDPDYVTQPGYESIEVVPADACRDAVVIDEHAIGRLAALIYDRDEWVRTMDVAISEAKMYIDALRGAA